MDQINLSKQWVARVADFKTSGQTMKGWCAAQGLKIDQLKYWLRKASQIALQDATPTENRWLSMFVTGNVVETRQCHPIIIRVGQTAIEVCADFDAALLRRVIHTLEEPC